jgi:predicted nucleotidyltransferase
MVFHKSILDVMSSKTKLRIIGFLIRHEALMSEREIAAVSGVSHMSVNRIMRELAEMNFVHILRAGRSNLWRVNRNSYVFHILSDKYLTLMDSKAPLEDLKNTILGNLPLSLVAKVILFGSIASNADKFNSDIDLFIQVKDKDEKQQIELATEKLATLCLERFGNVLSPYILTKEELKARTGLKLISNIKEGIILYPRENTHES